jgi:leader peptidase (prepilin peptidase) / N-methyltransferase
MVRVLAIIFTALAGLAFGSFLNVCLSRWPQKMSIVKPRSYCPDCGRTLTWWENIPLLSWLALRGRCRTCRAWIGWRTPLVELAIAALWVHECLRCLHSISGPGLIPYDFYSALETAIGDAILEWLLVALAVLDAENFWLPDRITIPGAVLGILFQLINSATQSFMWFFKEGFLWTMEKTVFAIAVAVGIILLIRFVYWLIRRREGIGLGDAKLMALLAAWVGLPGVAISFAVGVVLGAVVALVLLVTSWLATTSARKNNDGWALQKLPLGTFLCIGGVVNVLWGERIIDAYRAWAGF